MWSRKGRGAGRRRGQDAPLSGGELTSRSVSEPSIRVERTNENKGYRNSVPPRDVTGEAFELDNAAVPTTAIAGTEVPVDSAGILFPATAGMECPAVAEDLSLAVDVEGLPPAVRVREPLRPAARAGMLPDVEVTPSVELWGPAGPSSSHVLREGNENGNLSEVVIDLEPLVCPEVGDLAGLPSVIYIYIYIDIDSDILRLLELWFPPKWIS